MELTMDITANSDWCLDWLHIALFNENFFDFFVSFLNALLDMFTPFSRSL